MDYTNHLDNCPVCYGPVCSISVSLRDYQNYIRNKGESREVLRALLINIKLDAENHLKILNKRATKAGILTRPVITFNEEGSEQVVDPSNMEDFKDE